MQKLYNSSAKKTVDFFVPMHYININKSE